MGIPRPHGHAPRWLGLYWDAFLASLDEAVRKELEMQLQQHHWEPRSDWGKDFFNKGKTAGRAEGRAEGRAASILALLEHRGQPVSAALRERIMACTDLALLDHWLCRAATGHSLEETFAP
jgi:hypothetical protein